MRHYSLVCPVCGLKQVDDGLTLSCASDHAPALLQTEYDTRTFEPLAGDDGVFRYRPWLPVVRTLAGAGRTTVLRSEGLCRFLGMPGLRIAFNGYWPERGGFLETGTFKELEAYTVLGRMPEKAPVLVVASAGNTAAAFAAVCSRYAVPCLLIIPETGLDRLKLREDLHPAVRLVVVEGADYADAIALSEEAAKWPGFVLEGGVRNVARRDGLGTVMYAAVEETGELPEYYFQAVGSAAGAIAVHEAAKRVRGATSTPVAALPRLVLSQNAGFAPIHRAWQSRTRAFTPTGEDQNSLRGVFADELTNRRPPYAVHAGVFDVLTESGGDVVTVDREAAVAAREVFHDLESIDLEPAAAVAAASLFTAVTEGRIPRDASVLLNVTGGGRARMAQDHALRQAEPHLRVRVHGSHDAALDAIRELFDTVGAVSAGSERR
ncbi:cysteate synthase [Streptomyces sp. MNP-20]|uniref:cysteate synthase n=1 Tax=Streptomyces sp. MNP-20 TaxID=2721165 RepID=UPI0015518227|nr:cysteate synthase [Streptomyces sp. MNP-20]